jgi:hypothetical protein
LFARFIYRGGEQWRSAFTGILAPHHPDYPLLLPATIARCWYYAGKETQFVPILIAMLFTFATVALLISTLTFLRDRTQGLIAGIVLLGSSNFIVLGAMQVADVPLGFFFLATIVLIAIQDKFPDNTRLSLLAGMMAGFSCWTKNEGLLFLIIILAIRTFIVICFNRSRLYIKQIANMIIGTGMILIVVIWYKIMLAPSNDIMSAQNINGVIDKIVSNTNYSIIIRSFFFGIFDTMPLVLLLIIYFFCLKMHIEKAANRIVLTSVLVVSLMLAGYFFIYLITPFDVTWHLQTSLSRLLLQLWPSLLFAFFMFVRSFEETSTTARNVEPLGR